MLKQILNLLMPKKCIGCTYEGLYLCVSCKEHFLKKKNILLYEITENNPTKELSLYDFQNIVGKIRVVILFNQSEFSKFLEKIHDKKKLKEVQFLLERQIEIVFDYDALQHIAFIACFGKLCYWNDFAYNFIRCLRYKPRVLPRFFFLRKKFYKGKRYSHIVVVTTVLPHSLEEFLNSRRFMKIKKYVEEICGLITFVFLFNHD